MPELTIDRISPQASQRLDELALRQGRSRADVAGELLEWALRPRAEDVIARARQIRAMTPTDVQQTDSAEMIRALRDE